MLARKDVDEAVEPGAQAGDRSGIAGVPGREAGSLAGRGHTERALIALEEEERIRRQVGDADGLAANLANQALIHERHGQLQSARGLAEEAERIARERGLALLLERIRPVLDRLRSSS